ncbi:MAG TPA: response regulator [Gemmatimonadales bacterium]|nr:response regulator [Gemmatimonadales bacterium]
MHHAEDDPILPAAPGPLVLLADDELTPRSIVSRMVRTLGYQVRSCSGAREALRFMETHPRETRLLIADLLMPRMDGGELAERALDLDPGLRVLLMVGPGDPHAADLLTGYRDLPCIAKPVGFAALAGKLDELLGAPSVPPGYPPSMGPPRTTGPNRVRRRTSGRHEV